MTERWPSARKYRDIFEQIKSAVMDLIAEGRHQPRKAVDILDVNMRETFASLDQDGPAGIGEDFTHMISQMTGQNMELWDSQFDSSSRIGNLPVPTMSPQLLHLPESHTYEDLEVLGNMQSTWVPPPGFDVDSAYIDVEDDYSF
jgi:hypothetical protein